MSDPFKIHLDYTLSETVSNGLMALEESVIGDYGIKHPSKKRKNVDVDEMMDILVPSGMIILEDNDLPNITDGRFRPQRPPDNLKIDDGAILDCLNLAIGSHEAVLVVVPTSNTTPLSSPPSMSPSMILLENEYRWNESIVDPNDDDKRNSTFVIEAKSLPLPSWAVDPLEMSFVIDNPKSKPIIIEKKS
mmetsp:Transcript_40810/g.41415  ORF Transcript_40810/g.41415 Transcript_40810/m.41415 type:complete len:190 (-) Transcript_40810:17-586(-)